nr:MAG TPA: hypothetical protein [Caudoviricetes sp.]
MTKKTERMMMPIESQTAAQICAGFDAAKVFDWRG